MAIMSLFWAGLSGSSRAEVWGASPVKMSASALAGPAVPLTFSPHRPLVWFGGEFVYNHMSTTLLMSPQAGHFMLRLNAKYVRDYWLTPSFAISPSGGFDMLLGFGGATVFQLGFTGGGRLTYMVTPGFGIFVEPLILDMPLFTYLSAGAASGAAFGVDLFYRAMAGVTYRF